MFDQYYNFWQLHIVIWWPKSLEYSWHHSPSYIIPPYVLNLVSPDYFHINRTLINLEISSRHTFIPLTLSILSVMWDRPWEVVMQAYWLLIYLMRSAIARFWQHGLWDFTQLPAKGKAWLQFRAINYQAEIFVNGHQKLLSKGMFLRQTIDITSWLSRSGVNRLAVLVHPPDHPGQIPIVGGQGGDHDVSFVHQKPLISRYHQNYCHIDSVTLNYNFEYMPTNRNKVGSLIFLVSNFFQFARPTRLNHELDQYWMNK